GRDFEMIGTDQVGTIYLSCQKPQNCTESDAVHLRQIDRLVFHPFGTLRLERRRVEQNRNVVMIAYKLDHLLQRRVEEPGLQGHWLGELLPDFFRRVYRLDLPSRSGNARWNGNGR